MPASPPPFDFSQYVPGFEFLKSLAGGAAQGAARPTPGLTGLSNWIAPTLSVEEVDKRLQELKAVQFWLEQNLHMLKATVQALEVQKMTLSTLRGMNLRMDDLAKSFAGAAKTPPASGQAGDPREGQGTGGVDPLQWWSALTQQFQAIASQALQEAARRPAPTAQSTGAPARAAKKKDATKPQTPSSPRASRRRGKTPPA